MFPEKLKEKQKSLEADPNFVNVLQAFEKHVESDRNKASGQHSHFNCGALCIILSFIIAVIIVSHHWKLFSKMVWFLSINPFLFIISIQCAFHILRYSVTNSFSNNHLCF